MEKARTCAFQANYLLIWATNHGYQLLTARVHHGDYVHVFVSVKPAVIIADIVVVLKSASASCCLESFRKFGCCFGVGVCGLGVMLFVLLVL